MKQWDIEEGIIWDSSAARASFDDCKGPAKIRLVVGPTRYYDEFHLPSGSGSDWGPGGDIIPIESELPDFEDEHLGYLIEPLPLDFPLSSKPYFYPPGRRPIALLVEDEDDGVKLVYR